jgi:hypothetical protein
VILHPIQLFFLPLEPSPHVKTQEPAPAPFSRLLLASDASIYFLFKIIFPFALSWRGWIRKLKAGFVRVQIFQFAFFSPPARSLSAHHRIGLMIQTFHGGWRKEASGGRKLAANKSIAAFFSGTQNHQLCNMHFNVKCASVPEELFKFHTPMINIVGRRAAEIYFSGGAAEDKRLG